MTWVNALGIILFVWIGIYLVLGELQKVKYALRDIAKKLEKPE